MYNRGGESQSEEPDGNGAMMEPTGGAYATEGVCAMACSSGDGGARDGRRGSSDTPRGVPPPPGAIPVVTAADGGPSGATRPGLPVPPPPGGASPVCEAGSGDSGGPPPAPDANTGSSRDLILPVGVQIDREPKIVPYLRRANPAKGRTEDERSTYGGVWVPFNMHRNVLTISELAAQEGEGVRFSVVLAASNRLIRELGPDRARVVFEQRGTMDEMAQFDFIMRHEILRACVLQAIADTIGVENMRGINLSMQTMRDDGGYRDIVLDEAAQFMGKLNRNEAVDSFFGAPTTVPHAASKALPGSKKGGDVDVNDEYRYLAADIGLVRATIARHNLCRWLSYRGSDKSTTEAGDRTTTECLRELAVKALGIPEDRWPASMEELDGMGFYTGDKGTKGGVVRMAPYYVEHAQIIVGSSDDGDSIDDIVIAEEEGNEPKKKSHPIPMVVPGGPWSQNWLQRHGVDTSTTGFSKQASTVLRAIVNPVLAAHFRQVENMGNLGGLARRMFPTASKDANFAYGALLSWAKSERGVRCGDAAQERKKGGLYPHGVNPRDVNDAVRAYVLSVVELALQYEREGRFKGA